ncbi:MAG TPA: tetratricopeptide repeat protein [Longimicrobiaceae bacterium]|nr:tetratricopeptide repeat protein [Longimicrobiaceae bacterium]
MEASPEGEAAEDASGGAAPSPYARADSLMEQGSFAEAVEAYTAILSTSADDVRAILGAGAAHAAMGRYEAAEKELRRALRLAPDQAEVHHQLGLVLFKRGVYAAAATELRRAVELDPHCASAYLVLGEALNQMAESDQAIEALENATRIQPENPRAYYAMGIAYDRKGRPDRAAEMYRLSREVAGR